MKIRNSIISFVLFFTNQVFISALPAPISFWESSVWGIVEDETWLANSFGVFRIEEETKVKSEGSLRAWIHHTKHGWMWIESADLSNFWWYSESLGWASMPQKNDRYIYSMTHGWLYYQPGSSEPRWFYDFTKKEWRNFPLGYTPTDYFSCQKLPEPLNMVTPEYPSGFTHTEEFGPDTYGMAFHFLVDREGKVKRARLISAISELWERDDVIDAAYKALEESEFRPGLRNNEPVTLHFTHFYNVRKTD